MTSTEPEALLKLAYWESRTDELARRYHLAHPYPHVVLDDFLAEPVARDCHRVFPGVGQGEWIHYLHFNERKHGLNRPDGLPGPVRELIEALNSAHFLQWLSRLTGIPNLLADPAMEGGGLHQTERGGFLNVHADFTVHPLKPTWKRRVNLLIYLNPEWDENWNGALELWSRDMRRCEQQIFPIFNRAVIFSTDDDSFHGVPDPVRCPEGESRKSIALYYYTDEPEAPRLRPTNYQPRPDDGWKSFFIWADKQLVGAYTRLKRLTGFNDRRVSDLLAKFQRKKP